MNSKKAKALRRMARDEMADKPPSELVVHTRKQGEAVVAKVVNEPLTQRAMHLQLKKQYKAASQRGQIK